MILQLRGPRTIITQFLELRSEEKKLLAAYWSAMSHLRQASHLLTEEVFQAGMQLMDATRSTYGEDRLFFCGQCLLCLLDVSPCIPDAAPRRTFLKSHTFQST